MKALTNNKRHILFGMLLVTLGFSKAWSLNVNELSDKGNFASTRQLTEEELIEKGYTKDRNILIDDDGEIIDMDAPTLATTEVEAQVEKPKEEEIVGTDITDKRRVKGQDVNVTIKLETEEVKRKAVGRHGFVKDNREIVKISYTEAANPTCTTCKSGEKHLRDLQILVKDLETNMPKVWAQIDAAIEDEKNKEEKLVAERKNKEDDEKRQAEAKALAYKRCETSEDGKRDLSEPEHRKERFACVKSRMAGIKDREERADLFDELIADDMMQDLLSTKTDRERRDFSRNLTEMNKSFRSEMRRNPDLRNKMDIFNDAVVGVQEAMRLQHDSYTLQGDKSAVGQARLAQNRLVLKGLANGYNPSTNPRIAAFSPATRELIRKLGYGNQAGTGLDGVAEIASADPAEVTRKFFADVAVALAPSVAAATPGIAPATATDASGLPIRGARTSAASAGVNGLPSIFNSGAQGAQTWSPTSQPWQQPGATAQPWGAPSANNWQRPGYTTTPQYGTRPSSGNRGWTGAQTSGIPAYNR